MLPFIFAGAAFGILLGLFNIKNKKIDFIPEKVKEPKIKIVDADDNKVEEIIKPKITPASNKNLDKLDKVKKDDNVEDDSDIS